MHDSGHDDVNGPMRAQWRWFLLPSVVISGLLLIASQAVFLQFSFYRDRGFGRTTPDFTFANYVRFFTDSFYLDSLRLTAEVALIVVICSMLVGYPCAYILARMRSRWATILLAGIVVTALVTEVIKVLGLLIIFRADGFLNRALMAVGLVAKPVDIIGTVPGVVVGLLHFTLGFVLLLMFSVIQTIPRSLEDAARIAGASRWRAFWRVVFPLSLPGVIAGSLVIFNLSMGAFTAAAPGSMAAAVMRGTALAGMAGGVATAGVAMAGAALPITAQRQSQVGAHRGSTWRAMRHMRGGWN